METPKKFKSQVETKDERKKIMVIGITVIMVVVALLWVFNVKSFINPYSEKLISSEQDKLNWEDVKGRFDQTMSEVVSKMDQFEAKKELANNAANASTSLDNLENTLNAKVSSSSSNTTTIDQSGALKARLDDMEESLNKK